MTEQFKIRDMRKKEKYFVDDAYLNGYARLCSVYATAVYNSLSRHANFHNQTCFPSIERIAKQHNISRPSVIKALAKLEKYKIIRRDKQKDKKGRWKNNFYTLLDKSEWLPKNDQINDIDLENQVSHISKPSKRDFKNQVNDIDCKDNKEIKVNKCNDNKKMLKKIRKELSDKLGWRLK